MASWCSSTNFSTPNNNNNTNSNSSNSINNTNHATGDTMSHMVDVNTIFDTWINYEPEIELGPIMTATPIATVADATDGIVISTCNAPAIASVSKPIAATASASATSHLTNQQQLPRTYLPLNHASNSQLQHQHHQLQLLHNQQLHQEQQQHQRHQLQLQRLDTSTALIPCLGQSQSLELTQNIVTTACNDNEPHNNHNKLCFQLPVNYAATTSGGGNGCSERPKDLIPLSPAASASSSLSASSLYQQTTTRNIKLEQEKLRNQQELQQIGKYSCNSNNNGNSNTNAHDDLKRHRHSVDFGDYVTRASMSSPHNSRISFSGSSSCNNNGVSRNICQDLRNDADKCNACCALAASITPNSSVNIRRPDIPSANRHIQTNIAANQLHYQRPQQPHRLPTGTSQQANRNYHESSPNGGATSTTTESPASSTASSPLSVTSMHQKTQQQHVIVSQKQQQQAQQLKQLIPSQLQGDHPLEQLQKVVASNGGKNSSPNKQHNQIKIRRCRSITDYVLAEEEKRLLIKEGYQDFPMTCQSRPLSKAEERILRKIRRKIRNKKSAQCSRQRKKEYVEELERKYNAIMRENEELRLKLAKLIQQSNINSGQQY